MSEARKFIAIQSIDSDGNQGAICCVIDLAMAKRWLLSEGLVLYRALRNA